eukprot:CAMPEP_0170555700 /NCGR_PEP_ID=MMETSP0211-20121228/13553_1 /TAXON_ID=311385 /ORGANISM="Pseudokeronopsis sp., Strain OXSARD2" /LENGTH=63 /DNA_ID=CAMNT_0010865671 /DNA_START=610 /DNA_END=801 /DNA_ORIENTATION=+
MKMEADAEEQRRKEVLESKENFKKELDKELQELYMKKKKIEIGRMETQKKSKESDMKIKQKIH